MDIEAKVGQGLQMIGASLNADVLSAGVRRRTCHSCVEGAQVSGSTRQHAGHRHGYPNHLPV